MKLTKKVAEAFDHLLDFMAIVACVVIGVAGLLVFFEVIIRDSFGFIIKGATQLSAYSLVFITFLGTAWVLKREGHVNMDLVLSRLSPRGKLFLNVITSIICAIVFFLITWYGIAVTLETWQTGYSSSLELKIPMYLVYFIIPLGSLLLGIQFLRRTYGYLIKGSASAHR